MRFAILVVAAAAAACQPVNSDSIKTSGMYANFLADADGNGSTLVTARLKVGGALSNTVVDLMTGDKLSATSDAATQNMVKGPAALGDIYYAATFTGDAEGKSFTVALSRDNDTSAPNSTATLPAPFVLAPLAKTSFSRTEAITVSWSPTTADKIAVAFAGGCIRGLVKGNLTGDSLVVSAGELQPIKDHENESCGVVIAVARDRAGTVDPAYGGGGTFVGRHHRTASFQSTP